MICLELVLLGYLLFVVCCLGQHVDPLRCLPHPRKHTIEFTLGILLPAVLVRIGVFLCLRRRNSTRMRNYIIAINVVWNLAFALWTADQLWELLSHPQLADCKYNNHSWLEINYVFLIVAGVFPIVIITCFVIYCIGLLPYVCYQRCRGQETAINKSNVTKTLLRLLIRMQDSNEHKIFKLQ